MNKEEVLRIIASFRKGLGTEDEIVLNNRIYILHEYYKIYTPLEFRDGGRLGKESLGLYGMIDYLLIMEIEYDEKIVEYGKLLSGFVRDDLRLMASFLWNEGKSSLFKKEREKAKKLLNELDRLNRKKRSC